MLVRGVITAPFSNTSAISMSGGVVTIRQNSARERQPVITVYPFHQPQPYYMVDDEHFTTDGARYLFQLCIEAEGPLRVNAGYALLAALLISPEGLVLPDLDTDVLVGRRDRIDNFQLHTLRVPKSRFGLKDGSEIRFNEGWGDRVEFESLTPDTWGSDGGQSTWR